jgi:hypothetical protein
MSWEDKPDPVPQLISGIGLTWDGPRVGPLRMFSLPRFSRPMPALPDINGILSVNPLKNAGVSDEELTKIVKEGTNL